MLEASELTTALNSLECRSRTGTAFRVVRLEYVGTALSAIGAIKRGGRYNPKGVFEALYLADTPFTALREVRSVIETAKGMAGVRTGPSLLLSVDYVLQSVLDLTDATAQATVGATLEELIGEWLPITLAGGIAQTQQLGSTAHDLETIEGLLVPSSQDPRASNLAMFPDRMKVGSSLRVYDESGTVDAVVYGSFVPGQNG
jgi:RES domain-containing protein